MRKIKPSKKIKSQSKISACYIVKNEENNLPRSLESLKGQVDEIIVVDTGSMDRTIEIAKSYGAKIIEVPWEDDFSKPRNKAIEAAEGDWIIFLDADEFFIYPKKVRKAIDKLSDNTESVFVMRIDIDEDNDNAELNRDWYLRIFRNVDYLRYRGMIHENIENVKGGDFSSKFAGEDLIIYHTGYSATKAESKLKRNLAIINLEIKKYGAKPQHNIALFDCYFALKDYEKALHYARETLNADLKPITGLANLYRKMIISLQKLNRPAQEGLDALNEAIKTLPDNPEFYYERGLILYFFKEFDKAYADINNSIKIWNNISKDSIKNDKYFSKYVDTAKLILKKIKPLINN